MQLSVKAAISALQQSLLITDGVEKHHTTVGDHVRIGSDSMLVAPVSIGDGAYTAA